jgi:hypothetical protein
MRKSPILVSLVMLLGMIGIARAQDDEPGAAGNTGKEFFPRCSFGL